MGKEEAKKKIVELVKKYENLTASEVKSYNEAKTKQGFIDPLFRALGWNFEDTNEVAPEEKASGGRVDYAFKFNSVSIFFLEAKPLKADLTNSVYIKQTVTYAYNKGVTWALLTDFETLVVYVAQTGKPFITLTCDKYVDAFDDLWLLSKESFQNNALGEKAERYGALPQRMGIEQRLFNQLKQWREELSTQLHSYNKHLSIKQIDEVIQRLFNRLIFIRTCEDRGIENKVLLSAVHEWVRTNRKGELIEKLREIFRYFNGYYDSELFKKHLTDEVDVESNTIENLINGLYEVTGGMVSYDFSIIDADVLGAVYEQYLGHIANIVKQKAKAAQAKMDLGLPYDETIELTAKIQTRKEHGIYYTPKFITDYIVKETVGRFLAERSANEIRNIKILDPACGSGSFLIRAFDELLKHYASQKISKSEQDIDAADRISILQSNIFGVDLDIQAVEIARLNLLLRSLAKRDTLPGLKDNIKQGNSLISGKEEDLKKYFGNGWKDKKAFNWEEEFKDIMDNGGFDVVIGNPPWGGNIDNELAYFHSVYPETTQKHTDIFKIFIEANMRLVREGGLVSIIVPNTILRQNRLKDVRHFLLQNTLLNVVDLGENIFKDVIAPSCIFVVKKEKSKNTHNIHILDLSKSPLDTKIDTLRQHATIGNKYPKRLFLNNPDLEFIITPKKSNVPITTINDLKEFVCKDAGINYQRVNVGMQEKGKSDLAERLLYDGKQQKKTDKMFWKGSNINEYWIDDSTSHYCRPHFDKFIRPNEVVHLSEDVYNKIPKILLRQTADHIIATIDYKGVWFGRSIIAIVPVINSSYKIEYLLGLLNSKYLEWYYHRLVHETNRVFAQVKLSKIKQLPIHQIDFNNTKEKKMHNTLVSLVERMLKLNIKYAPIHDTPFSESEELKKEIEKTDKEIDNLVYDLYGLTEAERKMVEGKD